MDHCQASYVGCIYSILYVCIHTYRKDPLYVKSQFYFQIFSILLLSGDLVFCFSYQPLYTMILGFLFALPRFFCLLLFFQLDTPCHHVLWCALCTHKTRTIFFPQKHQYFSSNILEREHRLEVMFSHVP